METFGRHIIVELSGCRSDILGDPERIKEIMTRSAVAAETEVREVAVHKFSPQGVSCVVVIAESHLAIHTWPETGYAAVDIYTCGNRAKPEAACRNLAMELEAEEVYQSEIKRGIIQDGKTYKHNVKSVKRLAGEYLRGSAVSS